MGVLQKIFEALRGNGVCDIIFMDATIVKVHPDAAGALKKRANKALGEAKAD